MPPGEGGMTGSLFSRDWHRIAALKPKLRDHVSVHAHRYRGRRWYLLEDHVTGQVRRLTPESYLIAGLMDGRRSIDRLWEISAARLGEAMPTHEEMLQLLSSLYQANLVRMDSSGDVAELFERGSEATRRRWLAKLKSPLSIQLPLLDPNRFLDATERFLRPLFSRIVLLIWMIMVGTMAVAAVRHWDELTSNVADRVLAADNLLLLLIIYPLIKLVHELGHAYCVKRGGGEVHELGIMFLVLMPVPYVDASAASAFADKRRRILVGMAGIMVEMFIAAIAMQVWLGAESGLARSVAFNILFIAGVSTLLVNGNPLLRFDGYYVLSDWLEIPNLAQRANRYWGWIARRLLFGVKGQDSPAYDRREAVWLTGYGVAALIYRLFLMASIALFVAQQYFVVGVVLAVWALVGTLLWPMLKTLSSAWRDADIRAGGRSPTLVMTLCAMLLVLLTGYLPLPLSTSIEAVVQYDEERRVVAGENCFVDELIAPVGVEVAAGDLLLRCDNPRLRANRKILQQQLAEAEAQRLGVWDDPVQLNIYDQELARLGQEIDENARQLAALDVLAPVPGTWWAPRAADLQGRFISRGDLVGFLVDDRDLRVRGMVAEADVDLVRDRVERVSVVKASRLDAPLSPSAWQLFPSSSRQLVSPVLSEDGGGRIAINPASSPPQTIERYFTVDLAFDRLPSARVDERLLVRFEHPRKRWSIAVTG